MKNTMVIIRIIKQQPLEGLLPVKLANGDYLLREAAKHSLQ